jgi:hypothetical protein
MPRMNLRDVPDDVYQALASAAAAKRQSLNAYVIERLTEAARVASIRAQLDDYEPPDTRLTFEDGVAAIHAGRAENEDTPWPR